MNCKQGDLAVIVKTAPGWEQYIDRFVRCLEWVEAEPGRWVWEIDLKIPGALHVVAPDDNLRPIRDQPGQDEMLRIAGLPSKQDTGVPA